MPFFMRFQVIIIIQWIVSKKLSSPKKSGFDAIKFQIFKIDKLFHKEILKKSKFLQNRKKWELNLRFLDQIKKECKKIILSLVLHLFMLKS